MNGYYTKTDLKNMGFTEKMIKKLLGDPDEVKKNPVYKSAAPMKMWGAERVDAVMEKIIDENLDESLVKQAEDDEWIPGDGWYSRKQLKHIGFTNSMIKKIGHLADDYEEEDWEHPRRVWKAEDIETVMLDPEIAERIAEFQAKREAELRRATWSAFCDKYSGAAMKGVATKRKKTIDAIEARIAEIVVDTPDGYDDEATVYEWGIENWEDGESYRREIRSLENRSRESDYFLVDGSDADEQTKQRWAVNYIRHSLTTYDADLYENKGRVGKDEAYQMYRSAVLDKIAEAYPFLAEECARQEYPRERREWWQ